MLTVDLELVSLSRTFFPQSSSHGADWAFIERRWNFQGHLLLSYDGGLWNRQRNGPGNLGRSLLLMLLWALGECSASVLLVGPGRSITEGWGFHSWLSCYGLYLFCEGFFFSYLSGFTIRPPLSPGSCSWFCSALIQRLVPSHHVLRATLILSFPGDHCRC